MVKTIKSLQRQRRKENVRKKIESGSMTEFFKHEEINKGRFRSKRDTQVPIRVIDKTKKRASEV